MRVPAPLPSSFAFAFVCAVVAVAALALLGTPPAAQAAAPRPKLSKAERLKAGTAYEQFRALLAEGRKLVKADQPEAGMKKLKEALTKVPGHPSALGELGWAAYRAGKPHWDEALDATRKAIAVSQKDGQRGALWYNLGRISEDQGELARALDAYRQSLAYRPGNATVQKQLEGVVARLGGKDADDGLAKLEDACADLREEWGCAVVTSAEGQTESSCHCKSEILGPEEGFGRAALIRLEGTTEDVGGSVDETYLAIEVAAKWRVVTMVGNDWNPGMGYVSNHSDRVAFSIAARGTRKVAWVVFENTLSDLDPGVYTDTTEWSRTLTLCTVELGRPSCFAVPLGRGLDVGPLALDDEAIPEGEGPKEVHERWALAAELLPGGELALKVESGTPPKDLAGLVGTHALMALGKLPGVVALEL